MVFFNIFVDDHRHLCQRPGIGLRHQGEIGIVLQPFQLGNDPGILYGLFPDLGKKLGKVKGFHVDTMLLHGDLVKADGLKGRGTGTDTAQVKPLHAVHHPADGGKIPEIFLEPVT